MDEHFRKNHYRKPHEALLTGVNPLDQQKPAKINSAAYVWLYIAMAFVAVILGLIGFALWREWRKTREHNKRELEKDAEKAKGFFGEKSGKHEESKFDTEVEVIDKKKLYPEIEDRGSSSYFGGSVMTTTTSDIVMTTKTSEIQPKLSSLYPDKIDEMTGKSFGGIMNIHQQQGQQGSSSASSTGSGISQLEQQPPSFSSDLNRSSSISLAGNSKRMSKMESFPYEEYGIPENERQPIKTRVQDLKTYDHYLHLTHMDSEMMRDDSISEDGSGNEDGEKIVGNFESQATLPLRSSVDVSDPRPSS